MSRNKGLTFYLLCAGILIGCDRAPKWESFSYSSYSQGSTTEDVPIPESLWKLVIDPERPLSDLLGKMGSKESSQSSSQQNSAVSEDLVETDLAPLTIYLIEQTKGALGGRHHKIQFGPGGGSLDLHDFIAGDRGSFRVVFHYAPEGMLPKAKIRAWYLSNAKTRQLNQERLGAGCDVYMDISTAIANSAKNDGLLFAIRNGRYASSLSGTYLFSVKTNTNVAVSQVTIFDSSRRDVLCR